MDITTAASAASTATSSAYQAFEIGDETPPDLALHRLAYRLAEEPLTAKQLGKAGEQIAALWMRDQGCTVIDRNWQSRYGEIDLIVLDTDRVLVFVEVKTRRSTRFGSPQEAVTSHKQTNLRRASVQWLMDPAHRTPHRGVRFDVIGILAPLGQSPSLQHIREAF